MVRPEIAERLGVTLEPVRAAAVLAPATDPMASESVATASDEPPVDALVRGTAQIPALFTDPKTRPNSLRTAMMLHPPVAANAPGTYRSYGTPPPVEPSFLWTQLVASDGSPTEPAADAAAEVPAKPARVRKSRKKADATA